MAAPLEHPPATVHRPPRAQKRGCSVRGSLASPVPAPTADAPAPPCNETASPATSGRLAIQPASRGTQSAAAPEDRGSRQPVLPTFASNVRPAPDRSTPEQSLLCSESSNK